MVTLARYNIGCAAMPLCAFCAGRRWLFGGRIWQKRSLRLSKKGQKGRTWPSPPACVSRWLCSAWFCWRRGGTVPALYGLAAVLRGLGGDLRFALPLVFFWFGLRLARAARGERLPLWQILLDVLTALCLFGALHVFWGEMIDASGYHVQSALGYGDFSKNPTISAWAAGRWRASWAALPT